MPDIVLHNEMGKRVYERLSDDIKTSINIKVYRFGLLVPDYYMSYRFFLPHFRNGINKRGAVMHEEKCKEFLVEFAKNSKNKEAFSLLCGILCHFTLDSILHPWINKLAGGKVGVHEAIEHTLDMIELQRKNLGIEHLSNYYIPYYESKELEKTMQTVYGWGNDYLKAAFNHQKLYYRICSDRFGLLNFLFGRIGGKYSSISYRNNKCSDIDFECFESLIEESIVLAMDMINAAYAFKNGAIKEDDFSLIIGNRTYLGL